MDVLYEWIDRERERERDVERGDIAGSRIMIC
jgi:hypothetical protein